MSSPNHGDPAARREAVPTDRQAAPLSIFATVFPRNQEAVSQTPAPSRLYINQCGLG